MSTRNRYAVALGLLSALIFAAGAAAAKSNQAPNSAAAKLRERIVELRADVMVLEALCDAARYNLTQSLKELGNLELGGLKAVRSDLRKEMEEARPLGLSRGSSDSHNDPQIGHQAAQEMAEEALRKLHSMAESQYESRQKSLIAQAEKRKAQYAETARSLQGKKLALEEAEAEYKSSR
jgi:hypothetical protein